MLPTDQHLLRTNLFFVTETSELRLAGLHYGFSSLSSSCRLCTLVWLFSISKPSVKWYVTSKSVLQIYNLNYKSLLRY